jgi:hypothetical protein
MQKSESIGSLAAALAAAQGEMKGALKDASNPFFKSKYADLDSIWEACRQPLAKNGLAVIQLPRTGEGFVEIETMLCHSSGEWVSEVLKMPLDKPTVQSVGSAITYGRRYGLAPIAGVAPEDDDGNSASRRPHENGYSYSQDFIELSAEATRTWQRELSLATTKEDFERIGKEIKDEQANVTDYHQQELRLAYRDAHSAWKKAQAPA